MKKGWFIWILIIAGLVGVFFAFNYQGTNNASLTEIFPEDQATPKDVEYEFVDGAQVEETAQTIITQNPQAKAALTATTPATTVTASKVQATPTTTQAKSVTATSTTSSATTAPKVELSKIPFTIQVASFKEKTKADKILAEAKAKNFPAYLASKTLDTGTWYRIYIGEFKTKSEADQYLTQVKAVYQDSFIIAPK